MYADYMSNQPMRDGMEIRSFFDEVNEENQSEEKADQRTFMAHAKYGEYQRMAADMSIGAPWTPILKKEERIYVHRKS